MPERIRLEMSMLDVIITMSEGNPGAVAACAELMKYGAKIDPESFAGGLGSLMHLDTLGIYGSRIYMLWNDVCGRDVGKMIACLRAYQLGQISPKTLTHAIDNRGNGIDIDAVVKAVKERLPKFNTEIQAAV